MAKRYVFCVGTRYYGLHEASQAPEFAVGQVVRADCDVIEDYHPNGWLKKNKFLVEHLRELTPEERRGLHLEEVDVVDYCVVVLRRSRSHKAPVLAWPVLRLVYFWQWRSPRRQRPS